MKQDKIETSAGDESAPAKMPRRTIKLSKAGYVAATEGKKLAEIGEKITKAQAKKRLLKIAKAYLAKKAAKKAEPKKGQGFVAALYKMMEEGKSVKEIVEYFNANKNDALLYESNYGSPEGLQDALDEWADEFTAYRKAELEKPVSEYVMRYSEDMYGLRGFADAWRDKYNDDEALKGTKEIKGTGRFIRTYDPADHKRIVRKFLLRLFPGAESTTNDAIARFMPSPSVRQNIRLFVKGKKVMAEPLDDSAENKNIARAKKIMTDILNE